MKKQLAVFPHEERKQFRIADAETSKVTVGWAYKAEDAHLFAAAHELLEALKATLDGGSGADSNSNWREKARVAIAKAGG